VTQLGSLSRQGKETEVSKDLLGVGKWASTLSQLGGGGVRARGKRRRGEVTKGTLLGSSAKRVLEGATHSIGAVRGIHSSDDRRLILLIGTWSKGKRYKSKKTGNKEN